MPTRIGVGLQVPKLLYGSSAPVAPIDYGEGTRFLQTRFTQARFTARRFFADKP